MKKIKQLLSKYNDIILCCRIDTNYEHTNIENVLSPSSDFWNDTLPATIGAAALNIPYKVKKDIIHSFLLVQRSAEEMSMLKLEMKETLNYWLQRIDIIKIFLSNIESVDQFARGSQCLLMRMLSECQCHYDRAYSYFSGIIEISVTEAVRSTIADSDKSDSESDAESDSESESDEVDIGEVEDDENIIDF